MIAQRNPAEIILEPVWNPFGFRLGSLWVDLGPLLPGENTQSEPKLFDQGVGAWNPFGCRLGRVRVPVVRVPVARVPALGQKIKRQK